MRNESGSEPRMKDAPRWAWAITILITIVIVGVVGIGSLEKHSKRYPCPGEPARQAKMVWPPQRFESKPGEVWVKSGGQAIDTLRMEQWSKLFHLPPDHKKFSMDVSEEFHGIRFWDGTEWDREQVLDFLKSHDGWMSTVPSASFRLRGKGVVTVTVN